MPKIMISTEFLTEKAAELANLRDEQQQIIHHVNLIIEDLVAGWNGKAQKVFAAAYEEAKGTYDSFAPDLTRFSDYLVNYARTIEDLEFSESARISNWQDSEL